MMYKMEIIDLTIFKAIESTLIVIQIFTIGIILFWTVYNFYGDAYNIKIKKYTFHNTNKRNVEYCVKYKTILGYWTE